MNLLKVIEMPNDYKGLYKEKQIQNTFRKFWFICIAILVFQITSLSFRLISPFSNNPRIMSIFFNFSVVSIIINIILLFKWRSIKKINNIKHVLYWVFVFKSYAILWGIGIAIVDQLQVEEIVIYYTLLFALAIAFELNTKIFAGIVLPVHIYLLYLLNMLNSRGFIDSHISDSSTQIVVFVIFIHYYITQFEKMNFIKTQDLLKLNRELELKNKYDSLSRVYNRGYWERKYIDIFEEAVQKDQALGLVIIDIDYFKQYNDYYGHIEGDQVIRIVGDVLKKSAIEYGAIVGRFGGDEFIAVFDDAHIHNLDAFCMTLQQSIKNKKIIHQKSRSSKYLTLSIGSHKDRPVDLSKLWEFVAQADQELYNVKNERSESA